VRDEVDAGERRLRPRRALQVPDHLQPVPVGLVDGGAELARVDSRVELHVVDARRRLRPDGEADLLLGQPRVRQDLAGGEDARPEDATAGDVVAQGDGRAHRRGAGVTNRRDPPRQGNAQQPLGQRTVVRAVERPRVVATVSHRPGRDVVMHVDEARRDDVAGEVEHPRPARNRGARRRPDRQDAPAPDQDRGVAERLIAAAVEHRDMDERDVGKLRRVAARHVRSGPLAAA
jgi:hypothetical protein